MPPPVPDPAARPADWEAFYRDYRKPGYVVGFEITTKLGGGMFGLVFRARRMSIGKDYAIKFLQVDDGDVRKAVLSELEQVKYFAQIDHPNLVSIEDRGEVDGIPYLVMAFAGTETLRDKMPAGKLPSGDEKDELLRYFLQACRGLAALHERSLVHFDIKPANVFLKGGVARLGDYGLSKLVTHSRGSLSMGRGTPYYMAPEMLQRRGDHRSDVYSLGVLLYELLCGKVPFTGDSEWEVLKKHETAVPELLPHLTGRERAVLQRCLQKDPAARYQSVHDLIAAFAGDPATVGGLVDRVPAGAELPGCLAPPLPVGRAEAGARRRMATPPPLPRRRRGALAVLALMLPVALFAFALTYRSRGSTASSRITVVSSPASPGEPRRASATASSKVDQLVANLLKNVRTAEQRQRRMRLPDFDTGGFGMPRDFRLYCEQVQELGDAPIWSAGQAQKIERLGRPAFVAAVARLHDLDYADTDDCRCATQLQRFLGQMTAIAGLECVAGDDEVTEKETCRYLAVADGWRKIAESHAKNDAAFRQLLVSKGKVGIDR